MWLQVLCNKLIQRHTSRKADRVCVCVCGDGWKRWRGPETEPLLVSLWWIAWHCGRVRADEAKVLRCSFSVCTGWKCWDLMNEKLCSCLSSKRVMEDCEDRGHRLKYMEICIVDRASVMLGLITEGIVFRRNYYAKKVKKSQSHHLKHINIICTFIW